MSKRTRNTALVAGIILAGLAIPKTGIFEERRNSPDVEVSRDARMQVKTQIVTAGKLGDRVATVGSIYSNEEVEIRSEISGRIEQLFFKEGGRVRKGDLLLKMNDDELQAQLLRARSRQKLAEQQEARQRQLFEKSMTSKEEYDNALTNLDLAQAEAQLIQAQINKTEIRSPFDGNIGLRFVSAGSYVTPTMLITTIQDIGIVKIDFAVPEKYTGSIKVGDKVSLRVQKSPKVYTATVYALQPKVDLATRTLRVRASSPNRDGALLPGSLATIDISMDERDAILVPAYAVVPELKGHRVFVYKDGRAESRRVEIGIRTDENIEVVQGLQQGDTLITSAILQLRPGMVVKPTE